MSGTTAPPGVVVLDYAHWTTRYPDLATVSPALAQAYWDEAGLYLKNDGTSPVSASQRAMILGMIAAHIAILAARNEPGDGGGPGLVGRISSASQGSVSVGTDLQVPGSAAWWAQTAPGLSAWQAMAPLRTMRFYPAPRAIRRW